MRAAAVPRDLFFISRARDATSPVILIIVVESSRDHCGICLREFLVTRFFLWKFAEFCVIEGSWRVILEEWFFATLCMAS